MVKGEGGAMKKKVDVDLHDIVQNLPLKAAKGEVEVDWEKGVRHHIWAVSWNMVNGSTI